MIGNPEKAGGFGVAEVDEHSLAFTGEGHSGNTVRHEIFPGDLASCVGEVDGSLGGRGVIVRSMATRTKHEVREQDVRGLKRLSKVRPLNSQLLDLIMNAITRAIIAYSCTRTARGARFHYLAR